MFGASSPTPYADFSQALDPVTSYGQGVATLEAGFDLTKVAAIGRCNRAVFL
jgi:hypothetical protein